MCPSGRVQGRGCSWRMERAEQRGKVCPDAQDPAEGLLNLSQHPLHCCPWGAPHHVPGPSWGCWGPYTGWSQPPSDGAQSGPSCSQCPTLPACSAESLAFWFPLFPGNCNLWCLKRRSRRLCTSLCNKHLENLCWFWCCGMAAAESLNQHCSGSTVTSWCHQPAETAAPGEDRQTQEPWPHVDVQPLSCQGLTKPLGPWGDDGPHQSLFLGLGALRGACNGINSRENNHWKASNSLWAP